MKRIMVVSLCLLIMIGIPVQAQTNLTFTPTDDATVRESSPTSNYGADVSIIVDSSSKKDSLIKFDVSGIGSMYVTNAVLRVYNVNSSGNGGSFFAMNNKNWDEGTVTWHTAPPGDFFVDSLGTVSSGSWYEVDVISAILGDGLVSFRITSDDPNSAEYSSKEGINPPELIITLGTPPEPDLVAPTTPLNLRDDEVQSNVVKLSWDASTDNVGVLAYDLYRDSNLLTSVAGSLTSYQDTSVQPETDYTYEVYARDAAGNISGPSNQLDVTTPVHTLLTFDITRDSPTGSIYQAVAQTTSSSYSGSLKSVVENAVNELAGVGGGKILFAAGTFDLGLDWFEIDVSDIIFEGQGIDITTIRNNANASTDTEVFDFSLSDRIVIRDMTISAGGPLRSTSDAVDFDGGDFNLVERVKISNSRAKGLIFDGKDAGQTANNNVIRDCIIDGVPGEGIQFLASSDNLVENCQIMNTGEEGILINRASDQADQPLKQSENNIISGNYLENTGFDGIRIHSGDNNVITGNTIVNSSNLASGYDGIRVNSSSGVSCNDNIIEYNVAYDNQATQTQDFGLNIEDPECNRTVVRDNNFTGNATDDINDNGTDTIYSTGDATPPTAPTNLISTDIQATQVSLSWDPSTDNIGVLGYYVYRDGILIAPAVATTSYVDISVDPETFYQYTVVARDTSGNASAASNTLDVTTPILTDVTPPTVPANLAGINVQSDEVTLIWDASTDDFGVTGYAIYRDNNLIGNVDSNTLTYQDLTVAPETSYQYHVIASDAAGNMSPPDNTIVIITPTPDLNAPTTPANLTDSDVEFNTVTLNWDASTDNVGVTGYTIYRDGNPIDTVDSSLLTYQDLTVTSETSYQYYVTASDLADNESLPSNTVGVTTPIAPPVITFTPVDDASIRESNPTSNYGSATNLEVDASSRKDALLKFNVNGVGSTSVISAVLRLYVIDPSGVGGIFNVVNDNNWDEGTVTWNTAPPADFVVGSLGAVANGFWYEVDVTSAITGDGLISFRATSTDSNGADYSSKENANGNAPELVVTLDDPPPPDAESPSTPSNLIATSVLFDEVSMSWDASTDNVGVTGYEIYRDGGLLGSVDGVTLVYTDNTVAAETAYEYTVLALDAAGNFSALSAPLNVITPVAPDVESPSVPGNLIATSVLFDEVSLSWDASTDNVGVTGYDIYRDGGLLDSVDGVTLVYIDNTVVAEVSYNYEVRARDEANNESLSSNTLNVITPAVPDVESPSTPANLIATSVLFDEVSMSWDASTDNVGVTGYEIYRDGGLLGSVDGVTLVYTDNTVLSDTAYEYTVLALDAAGNFSALSDPLNVTTPSGPDTEAPTVPTGLATSDVQTTQVSLIWNPSTDNVGVVDYDVYRGGTLLASNVVGTSYTDMGLLPEALYQYAVLARDAAGNVSALSSPTLDVTTLADTDPPSVPGNLRTTDVQFTSVSLAWDASIDNLGFVEYEVYRDGVIIVSNWSDTSYIDTTVVPGTSYIYTVRAFDLNGLSSLSDPLNVNVPPDVDPPTVPTNVTATDVQTTQVSLSWDASTDNVGVVAYEVYRDGGLHASLENVTTFTDTLGVSPNGTYEYRILAIDAAANLSALSDPLNVTTPAVPDVESPSAPANLMATEVLSNSVTLVWDASTDNVGVTGYAVYRDTVLLAPVGTVTTYVDTTVTPSATHTYTVVARDAAGNFSTPSDPLDVVIPSAPDVTPPSMPTSLIATEVLSNSVTLAWGASSDDVGVTAYDIYRDTVYFDSVAGNVLTYQDGTVTDNMSYAYYVIARDGAGNSSAPSDTLNVITPAPSLILNFTPSDDASIHESSPTNNYGTAPNLEVDGSSPKDILLRFDISGVGATPIGNVTLRLYNIDNSPVGGQFFAMTDTNWSESTVTWNTAPPADGALLASLGGVSRDTWYEVDVTGLVVGDGPVSLRINSTHSNGADYSSKENSNGNAPELIVTLDQPPVPDEIAPTTPGNLTVVDAQINSVTLSWDASMDNVSVIAYDIYRGGIKIDEVNGSTVTYVDMTVAPDTPYNYYVIARDAAGNESAQSNTANVTTPAQDLTPPTAPSNLVAIDVQANSVTLGWGASSDNVGVTAYDIYRDNIQINSVGSGNLTYQDLTVNPDTNYAYYVIARDGAGNESAQSNTTNVTTPSVGTATFDIVREGTTNTYHATARTSSSSYTGSLKFVVESATNEVVALGGGNIFFGAGDYDLGSDWFELEDVLNVTFAGQGIDVTTIRNYTTEASDTEPFDCSNCDYTTVRDLTVHADGTARTTSDALDFDSGDYNLVERVKVSSSRGRGIIFDGKDQGFTSVGNIVRDCIVTSGVPLDGIQLLASDQNRIENCQILGVGRHGIFAHKASSSAFQSNKPSNDNLIIGNYVENVGGNGIIVNSSNRNTISGNTILNSGDSSTADGVRITTSSSSLACDDNVVEFNTATDNQATKTQRYGLNIDSSTCTNNVVQQNDFTGNLQGEINDNGTNTIYLSDDTEPPTAPSNLVAIDVQATSVTLNWNAASDNNGVAGYYIYRNGVQIDNVNGSTLAYQDTTVAPNTGYMYYVTAQDGAGNESTASNTINVTTLAPDITPPSQPGNLTAIDIQADYVILSWNASTDDVGVTGYDIYRDTVQLTSVGSSMLSYQDWTVAPNTNYQYYVIARDDAGNTSAPSNIADVTTPEPAPLLTFGPTDDATIRQSNSTTNYGSASNLEIDSDSAKDTLLRFEISGVGSSPVGNVTLRLYNIDNSSVGGHFYAMSNTSWSENTVTWDTAPPADGALLASLGSVNSGNWYDIDVTGLVTGDGPVSIRINSTNSNGADYSSKENGNGNAPELIVQLLSPQPSALEVRQSSAMVITSPVTITEPVVEPVETSEETIEPVVEPVETSEETTEPVVEPVETSEETTEPVVEPVETSEETIEPVVEPVETSEETTEPVVEPVETSEETTEPVVEPVETTEITEPVVEPVETTEVTEPVVEPVETSEETTEPVVEPVETIVEVTEPVIEPVETIVEVTEPVETSEETIEPVVEPVETTETVDDSSSP